MHRSASAMSNTTDPASSPLRDPELTIAWIKMARTRMLVQEPARCASVPALERAEDRDRHGDLHGKGVHVLRHAGEIHLGQEQHQWQTDAAAGKHAEIEHGYGHSGGQDAPQQNTATGRPACADNERPGAEIAEQHEPAEKPIVERPIGEAEASPSVQQSERDGDGHRQQHRLKSADLPGSRSFVAGCRYRARNMKPPPIATGSARLTLTRLPPTGR